MIGRGSEIIIPNSICKIFWLNAFNGGPTVYCISIFIIVWWIVFLSDSINQHKKIVWCARRQTDDAEKTKGIVTTCGGFSHLWPLEVDRGPRGPRYSLYWRLSQHQSWSSQHPQRGHHTPSTPLSSYSESFYLLWCPQHVIWLIKAQNTAQNVKMTQQND